MSLLQLYIDREKRWRWRLRADDQDIVGVSGVSFDTKADCIQYIEEVIQQAKIAEIEESEH
ncbi:MAG: YegP family protein [Candidatus Marinimicrobia bacterium]|nr:YegP family protein [Candidatus Neomarinimicrobiota bacterium]